jgi:phosphate transport system permease protein
MAYDTSSSGYPEGESLQSFVTGRQRVAQHWRALFLVATFAGIISLLALLYNVINESFGYVAYQNQVDPTEMVTSFYSTRGTTVPPGVLAEGAPDLSQLAREDQIALLYERLSKGRARALEAQQPLAERSQEELGGLLLAEIVKPQIAASWTLADSLFERKTVLEVTAQFDNATLEFRSWVTGSFLTSPQSSKPELAGVRTAIFGSLWVTLIAFFFSVPLGVGAAIYLEEYGGQSRGIAAKLASVVETNINNLAGVPSIIYGMLGLAVFVRGLEGLTSGKMFGLVDPTTANGRTVLSAGLTLGLLILPLIIINAREAIRAVPSALREAGYGLGATKWQTIRAHVLPNAIPGILTGVILGVSRALGETAPLVIVGASTFIAVDPNGPFSKFTTLPIQIYQWTARPQPEFQHLAAAAILVLLVLLLAMNATAVLLRNKYARSY